MKAIKKILGTLVTVYLTITVVTGGIVYFIKNVLDFMFDNNLIDMDMDDFPKKYDELKKDKDVRFGVISVIFGWPYYLVKGVSYLIKNKADLKEQLIDYSKKINDDKKVKKETEEDPEEEKEEKVCDFVHEEE